MFLDTATLHDLEIVPTPMTRGMTLWSLVDRTRTRLGREALRQRLLVPEHTAEEILALQRAHQTLAAETRAYRTVLDSADLDAVETYLRVKWQLPAHMPAMIQVRKWYRPYLQDVADGQARVMALLTAAADVRSRLSVTNARGFIPGTHAFFDRLEAHLAGGDLPDWSERYAEVAPSYPAWN